MNKPAGLPDWLIDDLLTRYGAAARELQAGWRGEQGLFESMLGVAVTQSERARRHDWPERKTVERNDAVAKAWQAANNAAMRLAEHLELDEFMARHRIAKAAKKSGVSFKDSAGRPPHIALAAFLRRMGEQELQKGPQAKPVQRRVFGPFLVSSGQRPRKAAPVTLLTVDLAFLFREVEAGRTTILYGAAITGGSRWKAAAAFARAAFDTESDLDSIERAARDWMDGKTLERTGWRRLREV